MPTINDQLNPVVLHDDASEWEPMECNIEITMPVPLAVFNDILKSVNKYCKHGKPQKPKMVTKDGKTIITILT